jgi:hypothetical protein
VSICIHEIELTQQSMCLQVYNSHQNILCSVFDILNRSSFNDDMLFSNDKCNLCLRPREEEEEEEEEHASGDHDPLYLNIYTMLTPIAFD